MKVGTKSLLFGVHQVALHPLFVAIAWWRLYGFRRVTCLASGLRVSLLDPRLWWVILVHDWGYWGCKDMDGADGKGHPCKGAEYSALLNPLTTFRSLGRWRRDESLAIDDLSPWSRVALMHSRSMARLLDSEVSVLCAPDKLAVACYPRWLYLALARASGELAEYIANADTPAGRRRGLDASSPSAWYDTVSAYMVEVAHRIVAGERAGVPPEDDSKAVQL